MADERTYKMLLGDIASGGSGGLPDYSEANDGDVLAIENGEPAWATPGEGGIDAFVIHYANATLDKTWQEIYDALVAEKLAIIFSPSATPGVYVIEQGIVLGSSLVDGTYSINTTMGLFVAATANDYPALD